MFLTIVLLLYMPKVAKENHLLVLERERTLNRLDQFVKSFDEKNEVGMGAEELIFIHVSGETFDDEALTYLVDELNKAAVVHDVQMVDGSPAVTLGVTGTSITPTSIDALAESKFSVVGMNIGPEIRFDDETLPDLIKLWNVRGLFSFQVYGDFSRNLLINYAICVKSPRINSARARFLYRAGS